MKHKVNEYKKCACSGGGRLWNHSDQSEDDFESEVRFWCHFCYTFTPLEDTCVVCIDHPNKVMNTF